MKTLHWRLEVQGAAEAMVFIHHSSQTVDPLLITGLDPDCEQSMTEVFSQIWVEWRSLTAQETGLHREFKPINVIFTLSHSFNIQYIKLVDHMTCCRMRNKTERFVLYHLSIKEREGEGHLWAEERRESQTKESVAEITEDSHKYTEPGRVGVWLRLLWNL